MRLNKKLLGAFAIAGAVGMLGAGSPAEAAGVGVTVVTGSGSISPGLSATPTAQTVSFTGTAAGGFVTTTPDADAGAVNCSFSGGSSAILGGLVDLSQETSLAGTGKVTGTCSGTGLLGSNVFVSCLFEYGRLGPAVTITGTCTATIDGQSFSGPAAGAFVFVPLTAQPTTQYLLAGTTVGVG